MTGTSQKREPVTAGPENLKNIRIVQIHNHKIKTGQAGQDYDTYYI